MPRQYKNIDSLKRVIKKKEENLKKEEKESIRKFSNIGFGHSMRCTKINISFSKEDKLKEELRELNIQLEILNSNI